MQRPSPPQFQTVCHWIAVNPLRNKQMPIFKDAKILKDDKTPKGESNSDFPIDFPITAMHLSVTNYTWLHMDAVGKQRLCKENIKSIYDNFTEIYKKHNYKALGWKIGDDKNTIKNHFGGDKESESYEALHIMADEYNMQFVRIFDDKTFEIIPSKWHNDRKIFILHNNIITKPTDSFAKLLMGYEIRLTLCKKELAALSANELKEQCTIAMNDPLFKAPIKNTKENIWYALEKLRIMKALNLSDIHS